MTQFDETELEQFRGVQLDPFLLSGELAQMKQDVLFLSLPPGIGKSQAAHGAVLHALNAGRFDLIIYVAPTRALITELLESEPFSIIEDHGYKSVVLERRPSADCGPLDPEWRQLEASGCGALARDRLCASCPRLSSCTWPDQLYEVQTDTDLIVLTEAYLSLNPDLIIDLFGRGGAERPLVIFDEGSLFTSELTKSITLTELGMYQDALGDIARSVRAGSPQAANLQTWINDIGHIIDGRDRLERFPRFNRYDLTGYIFEIQSAGLERFGAAFRDIHSDLHAMRKPWYHGGAIHYTPRIDTGRAQCLVLSPYLPEQVVQTRLDRTVECRFADHIFRHSETRIIAIQDNAASGRSLGDGSKLNRLVDFYAALVLRNWKRGQRTLLVARKRFLSNIHDRLTETLGDVGCPLNIALPGDLVDDTTDVALINYGIVGVNDYQAFDAVYCVGAYYAPPDLIADVSQQTVPHGQRYPIQIGIENGQRCTLPVNPSPSARYRAFGAQTTLEMLERRVVLQAVGRARPFTSATDVILMQSDDYGSVLGNIDTHHSLAAARTTGGVPTRDQMRRAALGDRLREKLADGHSVRAAADACRCAPSTARKALAEPELDVLLNEISL